MAMQPNTSTNKNNSATTADKTVFDYKGGLPSSKYFTNKELNNMT